MRQVYMQARREEADITCAREVCMLYLRVMNREPWRISFRLVFFFCGSR